MSTKKPQPAHPVQRLTAVLEATRRILKRDGIERVTIARVAKEAGVTPTLVTEYFPDRETLLSRIQQAGWRTTVGLVEEILKSENVSVMQRVRASVLTVFRTNESDEDLKRALHGAGMPTRDSPAAKAQRERGQEHAIAFFREVLPHADPSELAFTADFLSTALEGITERVFERKLPPEEAERWARATADMFCLFVESASNKSPPASGERDRG